MYFSAAIEGMARDFPCKAFIAFLVAGLNYLIGDPKSAIISGIAVLIALDWITGIIASWRRGEIQFTFESLRLCKEKAMKGGVKLLLYLSLCVLAYQLSVRIHPLLLGFLDDMIYAYIATTEAISILENMNKICLVCKIDLPFIPGVIRQVKKAQKTIDKTDDKKKEKEAEKK